MLFDVVPEELLELDAAFELLLEAFEVFEVVEAFDELEVLPDVPLEVLPEVLPEVLADEGVLEGALVGGLTAATTGAATEVLAAVLTGVLEETVVVDEAPVAEATCTEKVVRAVEAALSLAVITISL